MHLFAELSAYGHSDYGRHLLLGFYGILLDQLEIRWEGGAVVMADVLV